MQTLKDRIVARLGIKVAIFSAPEERRLKGKAITGEEHSFTLCRRSVDVDVDVLIKALEEVIDPKQLVYISLGGMRKLNKMDWLEKMPPTPKTFL